MNEILKTRELNYEIGREDGRAEMIEAFEACNYIKSCTNKQSIDEYLYRNSLHAKSVGVFYGIENILRRFKKLKIKKKWLIKQLENELVRISKLKNQLVEHREKANCFTIVFKPKGIKL